VDAAPLNLNVHWNELPARPTREGLKPKSEQVAHSSVEHAANWGSLGAAAGAAAGIGASILLSKSTTLASRPRFIVGTALALGVTAGAALLGYRKGNTVETVRHSVDEQYQARIDKWKADPKVADWQAQEYVASIDPARQSSPAQDVVKAYTALYDRNGDGRISLRDEHVRDSVSGEQYEADALLRRSDAMGNRDGWVTAEEIQSVVTAMDAPKVFQETPNIIPDGTLNEDDRGAFAAAFRERPVSDPAPADDGSMDLTDVTRYLNPLGMRIMQRYDRDYDGVISVDGESKIGSRDASTFLHEAETSGDGRVTFGEVEARLRDYDRHYYVGLGDWNGGTDGIIADGEDYGPNA
jgi:hypothetical protein